MRVPKVVDRPYEVITYKPVIVPKVIEKIREVPGEVRERLLRACARSGCRCSSSGIARFPIDFVICFDLTFWAFSTTKTTQPRPYYSQIIDVPRLDQLKRRPRASKYGDQQQHSDDRAGQQQEVPCEIVKPKVVVIDVFIPKPVHSSSITEGKKVRSDHRVTEAPPGE